jgi:hypothetical protein
MITMPSMGLLSRQALILAPHALLAAHARYAPSRVTLANVGMHYSMHDMLIKYMSEKRQ